MHFLIPTTMSFKDPTLYINEMESIIFQITLSNLMKLENKNGSKVYKKGIRMKYAKRHLCTHLSFKKGVIVLLKLTFQLRQFFHTFEKLVTQFWTLWNIKNNYFGTFY